MSDRDDKELVRRCLEGDRGAFESLVDRYQKTLFNFALRMTHSVSDAEDIAQSAFLKVYEKLDSFDPNYKFFSWLYRIAVNESLNFIKHRRQVERLEDDIVADEADPEQTYDEDQTTRTVQSALMELSENHRSVVILKHLQGFSYAEISGILNIPEKKVKSRLFTARVQLKDVLISKGLERE
jgi:RNA polymerase sigma-70 factor (ECF subfamily)